MTTEDKKDQPLPVVHRVLIAAEIGGSLSVDMGTVELVSISANSSFEKMATEFSNRIREKAATTISSGDQKDDGA